MRPRSGFVLCLSALLALASAQQVVTPDGPINGVVEQTSTGKSYYAYYSIPYAKPPTGSRRFQPPESPDPWTEPHDGTVENTNICYQLYSDYPEENEDCLHMNVFTPQDPATKTSKLPVMVNIHGGGFISGSGLASGSTGGFSPKFLIEEDVIFVSFNYRLGVFGFLSTGDEVIPGNAGLQDQIQALKWVQKNIATFGGDPNKVTILGQSAGAASVGYLILSPEAKGLFVGAILESGTPLCPWTYQRNQTRISFKTGSFIDPQFETSTDSKKLLEALQGADAKDIDAAALSYANYDASQPDAYSRAQMQQGSFFAPVIDSYSKNPVVPDNQYELLASGKINQVPILIGVCSEEGLLNYDQYFDYSVTQLEENPSYLIPQDIHVDGADNWAEVTDLIQTQYSIGNNNELGVITYFTHNEFVRGSTKHAELQSAVNDVYYYQFSYSGGLGFNTEHKFPGSGNVTHVEEWGYLYWGWSVASYPEEDQLVHNRLVRIWTNFAKYQNPTPTKEELLQNIEWPKVSSSNFQYVNIGNFEVPDLVVVTGKPKLEAMEFWEGIYSKYGNRPFDTY